MTTALRVADLEIPISDEKEVILEFIRNSTKGIMRGLELSHLIATRALHN